MPRMKALLQTSPALIATPAGPGQPKGSVGVYEFLTKNFAYISIQSLHWLEYFRAGKRWVETLAEHDQIPPKELWDEISDLVDCGFISLEKSPAWLRQSEYRDSWKWDLTSALFHFTVTDAEFFSEHECKKALAQKFSESLGPAKYVVHEGDCISLPSLADSCASDLLRLMCRRRTNRKNSEHQITSDELGACLFAGLGIIGEVATDAGMLPLKTTPSGGARNPFDAYVLVNRGQDVAPGIYHYSPYSHSLQKLDSQPPANQMTCFANQEWTEGKSAIIFLVANFERLMWKYPDPNAYRVMLIEAGHIGQNILLAATAQGLTACPTAALGHSAVSSLLGVTGLTRQPVYALTLDRPVGYPDRIELNSAFAHLIESLPSYSQPLQPN